VTDAVNSGCRCKTRWPLGRQTARGSKRAETRWSPPIGCSIATKAPRACAVPGREAGIEELGASGAKVLVVSNKGIAAIHRSLDKAG